LQFYPSLREAGHVYGKDIGFHPSSPNYCIYIVTESILAQAEETKHFREISLLMQVMIPSFIASSYKAIENTAIKGVIRFMSSVTAMSSKRLTMSVTRG
jgi:hypothetical protein